MKTKLYFKAVYHGMSILDFNKFLMYDFDNNYIKTEYGDKARLLNDTDSLAYEIKTKDFYKVSTLTLRNGLTLVTTRLIIHLE